MASRLSTSPEDRGSGHPCRPKQSRGLLKVALAKLGHGYRMCSTHCSVQCCKCGQELQVTGTSAPAAPDLGRQDSTGGSVSCHPRTQPEAKMQPIVAGAGGSHQSLLSGAAGSKEPKHLHPHTICVNAPSAVSKLTL